MIVSSTETLLACAWFNHAAGADSGSSSGKGCNDFRVLNDRSTLDISFACFTVIPIYVKVAIESPMITRQHMF